MAASTATIPMRDFGIYMIGSITSSWNGIEFLVEQYLSALLLTTGAHAPIVEALGNDTRTDIMFRLIIAKERRKDFIALCEHAKKHLLICRDNRNFISHGLIHSRTDSYIEIERFTKKRSSRLAYKIPYSEMIRLSEDASVAIQYVSYLLQNNASIRKLSGGRKRAPLPQIHALPRRISETQLPTRKVR